MYRTHVNETQAKPPEYRLLAFKFRGRAECVRYILAYTGLKWENDFIDLDNWPAVKPMLPMEINPVLFEKGKEPLSQTLAIGMYLASRHDLVGDSLFESAKVLELASGVLSDLFDAVQPWPKIIIFEKDQEKANEVWATIKSQKMPRLMKIYESLLEKNGGTFFVGNRLTWADLAMAEFCDRISTCIDPTFLDENPTLRQHSKWVHQLPELQDYLDMRPNTLY